MVIVTESIKVSEFTDLSLITWNEDKIKDYFPLFECQLILSIPLSMRWPRDKQIWFHNRDGEYSAKSGYQILCSSTVVMDGTNSSNSLMPM